MPYQLQLGNPSNATVDANNYSHFLIQRSVEAIDYNATNGIPNWASWSLTISDIGTNDRSAVFFTDTNLPPNFFWVTNSSYSGSGYARGHMCPSADRTDSRTNNDTLFLMSNIIPQALNQNSGIWQQLEDDCRGMLTNSPTNELLIVCGPSVFTSNKIVSGHVTVPAYTWKVVVVVPGPGAAGTATNRITWTNRVISVRITNDDSVAADGWMTYRTNAAAIENETGLKFFTSLSSNLAMVLRYKIDGQTPPAPVISGFSPNTGGTNSAFTITGSNLALTTNVTVNGAVAPYLIQSQTQISVLVPYNASSGPIAVMGLGGTTTTSSNYTVTAGASIDLAVRKSHTGNFTQGDLGDIYTIGVTNVGGITSTGTISVVDVLPAGLTASAINGTGWTCTLSNLTCTRSDGLPPGTGYPSISITVNVASNAPSAVTNNVSVAAGGDTNTVNNSFADATTILPAAVPDVTTGSAGSIAMTTATLNGNVDPNGQPTTGQFLFGLTTNYGSGASFTGPVTGNSTQAVSANISGLTAGTLYHYRLYATNVLGTVTGNDQTFTTAPPGSADLAIMKSHSGNFTRGDTADTYTIIVTNVGSVISSGSITVTDALPVGLTAVAISGSGWTTNLATLTCTRSDGLAAGSAFPPITLVVSVATNAPLSITNVATVAGGGDTNSLNNVASDPTIVNPIAGTLTTLAGWDARGLSNFGPTVFGATTNAANVTVAALTRGSGVVTNSNGAADGWGGVNWVESTSASAIASNRFATFGVTANTGYKVSFSAISQFAYRRSQTGATNGLVQYQVGNGGYTDVATIYYTNVNTSGSYISPIDLSGIPALQNVPAGTNVSFRIVNWGATGSSGSWYIYDTGNSTAPDLVVQGIVSPVVVATADLAITAKHGGNFTQGDTGDLYTINLTNVGTAASSGTITVVDTLPSGLTATAISGTGWSCTLTNLTCTRSDSLGVGAGYPAITVTVNVATNASALVTNIATVSGGSDTNAANNTALDPTTILALAPIQQWRLGWFGTTNNSGPSADTAISTSDGMANLYKYALGLAPLTATNDPSIVDIFANHLRLTAPRSASATDVTFSLQTTPDMLTAWTTNGTTIDVNSATMFQGHANTNVSTSASGYIRLKITRP